MNRFRKIGNTILSLFYPEKCSSCGEVTENGALLCDDCKRKIFPIEGEICHKCGVGLDFHDETKCREISAPVIAAYYYRDSVRNLIIDFKDTKSEKYFSFLSLTFFEKIAREYSDIVFDCAVCVPSRSQGKSTSEITARETAKKFLLDFDPQVLEKYRETEKQHRLNMEERFKNLEKSIRVRQGKENLVKGKTILLCDDVKTTGTTLSVCADALYKAGAKAVYCACIAVSDYSIRK